MPRSSIETRTVYLRRIDLAENARRWYGLHVTRSLFGDHLLVRTWGRLGSNGVREAVETHARPDDARRSLRAWLSAKTRRGYEIVDGDPDQTTP